MLEPATRERLAELILREAVGLGPLEEVLADPQVEEVMVNGPDCVYVERATHRAGGCALRLPAGVAGRDRAHPGAKQGVDELSPMVDARLADGSRVNVVIPPLAVDGASLSIRRFTARCLGPDELVALGTVTEGCGTSSRRRSGPAGAC